eukprot:g25661.t1
MFTAGTQLNLVWDRYCDRMISPDYLGDDLAVFVLVEALGINLYLRRANEYLKFAPFVPSSSKIVIAQVRSSFRQVTEKKRPTFEFDDMESKCDPTHKFEGARFLDDGGVGSSNDDRKLGDSNDNDRKHKPDYGVGSFCDSVAGTSSMITADAVLSTGSDENNSVDCERSDRRGAGEQQACSTATTSDDTSLGCTVS